ncbi:MAG TPA: hypothetical protein VNR18_11130 [Hyphomicrobiales bacterium]|nr:hypothetical protein [Hyphomicrobiales bacterium]
MNEPQPTNMPPNSEPKAPGESNPTDLPGQSADDTRPLLEEEDQDEDLEDLEPEEPVGTPESNQQVP